jgi:hypothetical protein
MCITDYHEWLILSISFRAPELSYMYYWLSLMTDSVVLNFAEIQIILATLQITSYALGV